MKKLRWALGVMAIAVLALALAGCSLFQATLTVLNGSSYTVTQIYISKTDEASWGDDWLTGSIPAGGSRVIEGIWAGDYDLLALEAGGGGWLVLGREMKANQSYTWTLTNASWLAP